MKNLHANHTLSGSPTPRENSMPPPQRKQKGAKGVQSVYPPRSVSATLGGYRSTPLTQAIRCWAKLLEEATIENAQALTPGEWAFLARAAAGREGDFNPEWNNPGDHLAQMVERSVHYEVGLNLLGKGARDKGLDLARRLRELDYLHAWAVIWALQWNRDLGDDVKEGDAWWTLGHRQARIEGG